MPTVDKNITMRGAESRHTLILIDGRRVTGELTKTRANAMGWLRQGMDNVERIEITPWTVECPLWF